MSIDCLVRLCVVKVYLDIAICLRVGTTTINKNNPLARLVIQYSHVIEFIHSPLADFFFITGKGTLFGMARQKCMALSSDVCVLAL